MDNIVVYNSGINPIELIKKIEYLDEKCKKSEGEIVSLQNRLAEKNKPIRNALARYEERYKVFGKELFNKIGNGLSNKEIVELVSEVEILDMNKISIVSDLIASSNDNMKIISELISSLSILSGMTYQSIADIVHTIDDVDKIVDKNVGYTNKMSSQLRDFIKSQFRKVLDDKDRYDSLNNKLDEISIGIGDIYSRLNNLNNTLDAVVLYKEESMSSFEQVRLELEILKNSLIQSDSVDQDKKKCISSQPKIQQKPPCCFLGNGINQPIDNVANDSAKKRHKINISIFLIASLSIINFIGLLIVLFGL